jgi:hypothetical protein
MAGVRLDKLAFFENMGSSLLTHLQPVSVRDGVRLFTKYPFIKPDTYNLI